MTSRKHETAADPGATTDAPEFSIVIPAKDEAESIGPLIDEIAASLDTVARFEVVCVDDGSRDDTAAVLRQTQARHPWLRVIRHEAPCGQSTATLTGVRRAAWPCSVRRARPR
jgi:glycosyltransferase involved in cell wall biosynthesis